MVALTCLLLLALFAVRAFTVPYPLELAPVQTTPLGLLIDKLIPADSIACGVVSVLMMMICSVLAAGMISREASLPVRTFLPLVFYLLTGAGLVFFRTSVAVPVAAMGLIVATELFLRGYRRSYQFDKLFRAAFAFGLIPLIYSPALLLLPAFFVALIIFQRTIREVIFSFIGFLLPAALCSFCWWTADYDWGYFLSETFGAVRRTDWIWSSYDTWHIVLIAGASLLALNVVAATVAAAIAMRNMRNRTRRLFAYSLYLFVTIPFMSFLTSNMTSMLLFLAFPVSFLATLFYVAVNNRLARILYMTTLGAVVALNIIAFVYP